MRVTRRGQVTIPKPIRARVGIDEGDEVAFSVEGSRIVIEKEGAGDPFARWVGYLRRPGGSDALVRSMRGPR